MTRKGFFREPSLGEIRQKQIVSSNGKTIPELLELVEGQYLVTPSPLVGTQWESQDPVKFQKHGPEIVLARPSSIKEAEEWARNGIRPLDLRRQAYDRARAGESHYSCFSIIPLIGKDKKRTRVGLVQVLDGARIFAFSEEQRKRLGIEDKAEFYSNKQLPGIKIKPYDDARRVAIEGAQIIVDVPTYERDARRTSMTVHSVPVEPNRRRLAIALGIGTDHVCGFKRFKDLRYTQLEDTETSLKTNLCKHDCAAIDSIVDFYRNVRNQEIPTFLENVPIAIPSQLFVDLYKKMLANWLIFDENVTAKHKLRKPNQAEKEVELHRAVKQLGYDRTLYSSITRDGKLGDYNWTLGGH